MVIWFTSLSQVVFSPLAIYSLILSVLLLHQGSNFISLSILLLILEGVFFSSSLKRILAANITLKEKAGKIGTWQRTQIVLSFGTSEIQAVFGIFAS